MADRDGQSPTCAQADRAYHLPRLRELGEQTPRPLRQQAARRRQLHSLAVPHEQLDPELAFERLEAHGEGRLRHVQMGRRPAHGAVVGDREETLQPTQVHSRRI